MPAYIVEYTSGNGPGRASFTLDASRPLEEQITLVLGELAQRGVVLDGGPADELVVLWEGRRLDGSRSPTELGVTPDRPLRLQMERRAPRVQFRRPEGPIRPFLARGAVRAPLEGALGGALAWYALAWLSELAPSTLGPVLLDRWGALLLGASIGGGLGLGGARRAGRRAGATLAALAGAAVLGALGALLGAWAGERVSLAWLGIPDGVTGWVLLGGGAGLGLGLRARRPRPSAVGAALVGGGVGGGLAALLVWMPVPLDVAQAAALVTLGALVGVGTDALALQTAPAVLTLESDHGVRPGPWRLREWATDGVDGVPVPGPGGVALGELELRAERLQFRPVPGAPALVVAGAPAQGAVPVVSGDALDAGPLRYRLRKRRPL